MIRIAAKLGWKFIQIDIRDTDSYSDWHSLFQAFFHSNLLVATIHIKNLYLHEKTYNMDLKWNLYPTSLSRRGSVNPSTPTFGKINLTKAMIKLTVPWKFSQKRMQESLFAPQTL